MIDRNNSGASQYGNQSPKSQDGEFNPVKNNPKMDNDSTSSRSSSKSSGSSSSSKVLQR